MSSTARALLQKIPSGARHGVTVGIRREDPSRIWERRCPLDPEAVDALKADGVNVLIEDCARRVFPIREFIKAGAEVRPDLSGAHIIVGIKETPLDSLITTPIRTPLQNNSSSPWIHRTHVMFSHTAKGQPYNTPLLERFLSPAADHPQAKYHVPQLSPRLIDYELLTDAEGKRTVAFGWFAGVAGVLESLSSMAHAHLELGIASPFLYTPRPHTQKSLDELRQSLRAIGQMIQNNGTPKKLGPFIIGVTGSGNVSQGCLNMLGELPVTYIPAKRLPSLVANQEANLQTVYVCHIRPEDYLNTVDGGAYNREHYYNSPQSYQSNFATKIAPYLTLFLNGAGWQPSFPRLMTTSQLGVALELAQAAGGARFQNIGDISCDIEGGLEFMTRATTISAPFYKVRPAGLPSHLPPVQIMSVDILPASIPLDASRHFSSAFLPYIRTLVAAYKGRPGAEGEAEGEKAKQLTEKLVALDEATIAQGGVLRPPHAWLMRAVDTWRAENPELARATEVVGAVPPPKADDGAAGSDGVQTVQVPSSLPARKKNVLMLGSGMVAGPAVDEIAQRADVQLLVASNSLHEVEKLVGEHRHVQYRVIDMQDLDAVNTLVGEADVVISLLPAPLHPAVAELCIKNRKHLVTASYISPEMKALHNRALDADVLLLNEIGLDPGIDHCSAIDMIERLRREGKTVQSFISFCGGLPAPDVMPTPLRYKFSWSPRGVLAAALNGARYKLNRELWNIPGDSILKSHFPNVPISNEFDLEGIANRDSVPYMDTYNLGPLSGIRTILRGTLRYPGFSHLMQCFKSLGLLETEKKIYLKSWSTLLRQSLALQVNEDSKTLNVHGLVQDLISKRHIGTLFDAAEWLGLLNSRGAMAGAGAGSADLSLPPLPDVALAPIDHFSVLLAHRLRYRPGERDMVVLAHEIVTSGSGGPPSEEAHTATLVVYGTPRASAMARTVGLPVAYAALRVLDGGVPVRGVAGPADPSVYRHVLTELERAGLGMVETRRPAVQGKTIESALMPGL